jgi:NADH-quinone oxidoreductase subunit L
MVCIAVGALALSGVYPFSGFFSKEAILGVLAAQPNKFWLAAGVFGAVLTAYYSFRLIFFILFPKGGIEAKHQGGHAHSAHGHEDEHHSYIFWAMAIPVMILAGVSLVLGFVEHPIEQFLGHGSQAHVVQHAAEHGGGIDWLLVMGVSAGLSGIVLAWFEFGRKGASRKGFLSHFPAIWKLFDSRWGLDVFYRKVLDTFVYGGLTSIFAKNDRRLIDGGIDGMCYFIQGSGRLFSLLQSGMLQYNLLIMVLAAGAAVLYFLM